MTPREQELALIAEHVAKHGVTRPTGPAPSDTNSLSNVAEARERARRNGVRTKQFRTTGRISINGGPAVQGSRFVAYINGLRARQMGTAVRLDASKLPVRRSA